MIIRDLVNVRSQPTVVRLDHLSESDNAWISESYYITAEVGNHFKTLDYLLGREEGQGVFLIGHYGSGKSHFLAFLTQSVEQGKMGSGGVQVRPVSLLNYSADKSLESIIIHALSLPEETDRRQQWQSIVQRYPSGLLLILDELSEFLRSKPDMRTFNEDIRYLQFMGEWATDHKLWIVAALQEKIEHTGEMEYDLFRKIKDRYPMRLLLSPTHVKDLIGERILLKQEGYDQAVGKLAKLLKRAFPDNPMDYERFSKIYPLHPVTLDLLEEVRDRFSQARGIVGFTLTRLGGDPARNHPPFLDQDWGALLSPDSIVDHFRDLFEVQPEFLPLAQKVLPYYRKHVTLLFNKEALQVLAHRLLKLMILVHLSPERNALTVREAAWWLLYKVSTIDPSKNEKVIDRILNTMAAEGAYVKKQGDAFHLDLEDDSQETLDNLITRTSLELESKGHTLLENLIPLVSKSGFNPFNLDRDRWQKHSITWFFHDRTLPVYFGGGAPELKQGPGLQIGLPWGQPPSGRNCYRLVPNTLDMNDELLELASLLQLRERPLTRQVLEKIEERIETRRSIFLAGLRTSYQQAILFDERGEQIRTPISVPDGGVKLWVSRLSELIFRRTWPRFENYAPTHGPLPRDAYRQLMDFAQTHDLDAADAPDFVRTIREAYLVPMKLMDRKGRNYRISTKLDAHELVTAIKPMLAQKTSPKRFYEQLSLPVYGLVPDQIHLLLLFLSVLGEIDILKGRNSYRDLYESFPTADQYDIIIPGKGLNLQQLQDLTTLCTGLEITPPKESNVLAQRRCAAQLQRFGRKRRDELSTFLNRIEGAELGDLRKKIERHIALWAALEKGEHELQGVQHFMFEIGSPGRFLETHGELLALPRKLENLMREMRRLAHLLQHPAIAECEDEAVRLAVEHLGAPPNLSETDALEEWLDAARRIHGEYKEWYVSGHEGYWSGLRRRPIWDYRIPSLAKGRHLGLSDPLATLGRRQQIRSKLCHSLSDLEFQPACLCGFDGTKAAVGKEIEQLDAARDEIEETLTRFFGQDKVKQKVREWLDTGVESHPTTHAYLAGEAPFPHIANQTLFDQHLSGLELFRKVPLTKVTDLLQERVWDSQHLLGELKNLLGRLGPRVAFEAPSATSAPDTALTKWCLEQSLRTGSRLPAGLPQDQKTDLVGTLQPAWVSTQSLKKLDQLGLGHEIEQAILAMVLDGRIKPPKDVGTGSLQAVTYIMDRPKVLDPAALGPLCAQLYTQHERMLKLSIKDWLACLEELAHMALPNLPSLFTVLEQSKEAQWLLIDCMGVALLPALEDVLGDLFPRWKQESVRFAYVSPHTDTGHFYQDLAEKGVNKAFIKRNAIDDLIHAVGGDFPVLERRALAELEIMASKLNDLDTGKDLLIFADHGFRMRGDGKAFVHGGTSTLERLVPLIHLVPYR